MDPNGATDFPFLPVSSALEQEPGAVPAQPQERKRVVRASLSPTVLFLDSCGITVASVFIHSYPS
jgi:hypothetical protein